jgi:hypothetical protein
VRFSVVSEADGVLRVVWILEREHAPASHGYLEYDVAASSVLGDVGELMIAQVRAFLEAYLRTADRRVASAAH